jgi:sulfite reductase (NADPH) flavoprotein alpha-component
MILSIWRYSHLALAISSFVFILLASITGIILAIQPISEQFEPYKTEDLGSLTIAQTVTVFQDTYPEILDIKIDHNDFVVASVFTNDGENLEGYFNPKTAKFLGEHIKPSPFFQWITNFHRSLFLKSTGRFLVGLGSFLLFLIAITGSILILKRQKGFIKFFSRIIKENFNQYWHIVLGRLSLIPIIIITLTGVYLSLEKFDALPKVDHKHQIDYDSIKATPKRSITNFDLFKTTPLNELESLEFPFSSDVEDVFTLQLHSEHLIINQYTGEILSRTETSWVHTLSKLSLKLHTGQGSIIWAIILAIASVNILFFIYSGFAMTFKRRASKLKNVYALSDAEILILVGSENGSTFQFANAFHKQLLLQKRKVHIAHLNHFKLHHSTQQIIIFAATYGQGEAPSNATKFLKLIQHTTSNPNISYAVLGFGSLSYPNYCQFAIDVDNALKSKFTQVLQPFKINDKSIESFQQWTSLWSQQMHIDISIPETDLTSKPQYLKPFKVTRKSKAENNCDNTFLIELEPQHRKRFTSGDLLAIYPKNDHRERLYSIGKVDRKVQLSVKLHYKGIGSTALHNLQIGDTLKARIIRNTGFHSPKNSKTTIMIANGTGIAPFLGMLDQNRSKSMHLYFGLRTAKSKALYHEAIQQALHSNQLKSIKYALSQEENSCYVQDLILEDESFIADTLKRNGTIMICGSLAMYEGVLEVLKYIIGKHLNTSLEYYLNKQQIKSDCY